MKKTINPFCTVEKALQTSSSITCNVGNSRETHADIQFYCQKFNPVAGVLVKFDQLTFKARTFEGTNVIATNGSQLMQLLPRGSPG